MSSELLQTPLHATHTALGARMAAFGGWDMPIQYSGILAEHQAVRTGVGIFDVSHMGEFDIEGPDAAAFVDRLTTNDVGKLSAGRAQYTLMCQPDGGIVDDCIVYALSSDRYRIVVNAANIADDLAHIRDVQATVSLRATVTDCSDEWALLAVQGPQAVALVATLAGEALSDIPAFGLGSGTVSGTEILAARTGYTGEDGFELFVPALAAQNVWQACTEAGATPVGLGARDTLRLEARLSLYGNDIDRTTNPYEAGLGWVVKLNTAAPFVGKDALSAIHARGPARKLVGFKVDSRGIARAGANVIDESGAVIGRVTSGGVAPTVGGAIGLAYVPSELAQDKHPLRLAQRGRTLDASQVKGPFYRRQS